MLMDAHMELDNFTDRHSDLDMKRPNSDDSRVRICDFCGKGFNSGKALGGHRRIHFQASSKKNVVLKFRVDKSKEVDESCIDKNINCCLCNKNFPSMKALFGHMRNHPERAYRGMKPPTLSNKPYLTLSSSSSSSSQPTCFSSTLSEESDDEHINSDTENSRLGVDLLKTWSKKDKRGRKSLVNHATIQAANCLMKLRQERVEYDITDRASSSMMLKKLRIDETETRIFSSKPSEGKLMRSSLIDSNNIDRNNIDTHELVKKLMSKNKIKKPENWKANASLLIDENHIMVSPTSTSDRFRCSTCNKSFPSFQALGGHRSIHTKERSRVENAVGRELSDMSLENKTMWQYMINEVHKFPMYEAILGPVEARLGEVALPKEEEQSGTTKLLNFDLNEPAANENEV